MNIELERESTPPRWRTIPIAFKEYKEFDPNTAITITYIKKLAQKGFVRKMVQGSQNHIDMNSLYEVLAAPPNLGNQFHGDEDNEVHGFSRL